METFKMNTGDVYSYGGKLVGLADEFGANKVKIDQIVNNILASEYTSDDAKAIASEIRSYTPILNSIHEKLERQGKFGIHASRQTANTQEEIISSIKNGEN